MAGKGAERSQLLSCGKTAAFKLLKQASDDAEDARCGVREFAVSKRTLLNAGACESDLRWLVAQRYADSLEEVTQSGDSKRRFRAISSLILPENACFTLSHGGKVFLELHRRDLVTESPSNGVAGTGGPSAFDRIRWDRERHELWVDGKLAKRFTRRAQVQWAALDAFQAAGWHAPLKVALPSDDQRNPAQRLRELIAELNKNLEKKHIRFRKVCGGNCISYDLPSVAADALP